MKKPISYFFELKRRTKRGQSWSLLRCSSSQSGRQQSSQGPLQSEASLCGEMKQQQCVFVCPVCVKSLLPIMVFCTEYAVSSANRRQSYSQLNTICPYSENTFSANNLGEKKREKRLLLWTGLLHLPTVVSYCVFDVGSTWKDSRQKN